MNEKGLPFEDSHNISGELFYNVDNMETWAYFYLYDKSWWDTNRYQRKYKIYLVGEPLEG